MSRHEEKALQTHYKGTTKALQDGRAGDIDDEIVSDNNKQREVHTDTVLAGTDEINTQPHEIETVEVTALAANASASIDDVPPAREARAKKMATDVRRRLHSEGRWSGRIEDERDEMMRMARNGPQKMSKVEAQLFVYTELDRLYPPLATPDTDIPDKTKNTGHADCVPVVNGQILGLGDIPSGWPELPANASLSAEVGWVQANRLRVIEEQASGQTLVHLGRALSPAPSWAALGWLETSIRSYAKYVDVAAKATASDDGEASVMRRERMAIEDVCSLLDEMIGAG